MYYYPIIWKTITTHLLIKKKDFPFASLIRNTLNNLRRKTQDD